MNKLNSVSRTIAVMVMHICLLFIISPQAKAVLVEFNSLGNYSSFSFEGDDVNGDGYLVYDEVSRLTPFITNIAYPGQSTYEYFGWGVFDINTKYFLNDTFSAWDIPTRPTSYATEEEWVQYIFDSHWGDSSNYTIEQMSMRPEPGGVSRIVFDGINGIGFSNFYSVTVATVPAPGTVGLMLFGVLGLFAPPFLRRKKI